MPLLFKRCCSGRAIRQRDVECAGAGNYEGCRRRGDLRGDRDFAPCGQVEGQSRCSREQAVRHARGDAAAGKVGKQPPAHRLLPNKQKRCLRNRRCRGSASHYGSTERQRGMRRIKSTGMPLSLPLPCIPRIALSLLQFIDLESCSELPDTRGCGFGVCGAAIRTSASQAREKVSTFCRCFKRWRSDACSWLGAHLRHS